MNRYIRLTPLFAVCVLLSFTLYRFSGNGPVWPISSEYIGGHCVRYWWTTLLYIQNYYNTTELCFLHSWSLSFDMQLYFIAPAIAYLIYKLKTKAHNVLLVTVLSCIACTLAVHTIFDLRNVYVFFNTKINFENFPIDTYFKKVPPRTLTHIQ